MKEEIASCHGPPVPHPPRYRKVPVQRTTTICTFPIASTAPALIDDQSVGNLIPNSVILFLNLETSLAVWPILPYTLSQLHNAKAWTWVFFFSFINPNTLSLSAALLPCCIRAYCGLSSSLQINPLVFALDSESLVVFLGFLKIRHTTYILIQQLWGRQKEIARWR